MRFWFFVSGSRLDLATLNLFWV